MTVSGPALVQIPVNGLNLACLVQGDGPLVLCLHGFPDTAHGFDRLLPVLAAAGYRAVAPFLRGYYPSALAPDGDYSMPALGRDVLALAEALGEGQPVAVIGHDWGGYAAIAAANLAPERVQKIAVLSVPHIRHSAMALAQLRRSWYVLFFQLPWLPEWRVARDNFAFIDRLYAAWSPHWPSGHWQLEAVKRSLAMPGGLQAALAYYRAMIRGSTRAQRALLEQATTVPALVIYGDADGSIGPEQFRGLERAYTAGVQALALPGVGHFPHREAPEQVFPALLDFLAQARDSA